MYAIDCHGWTSPTWGIVTECIWKCEADEVRIQLSWDQLRHLGPFGRQQFIADISDAAQRAVFVAAHGCTP